MRVHIKGGIFNSEYNQKVHKRDFWKFLELEMKDKSLKLEKSEKPTFEIWIWMENDKLVFFIKKLRARANGGFFSGYAQRCAKNNSTPELKFPNWHHDYRGRNVDRGAGTALAQQCKRGEEDVNTYVVFVVA